MSNLISHNAEEIYDDFLSKVEDYIQEPLYPGDERRIFAEALIAVVISFLATADDLTKQKFLQNARGEVLDANGEAYGIERILGTKAVTQIKFSLNSAVSVDINIPKGTIVTNDYEHYFETVEDAVIKNGELHVIVAAEASEAGADYNNIGINEIDVLVDSIAYIDNVSNVTVTQGGTYAEDDDTYRERIRLSQDRYAAGTENYYKYQALSVAPDIQDMFLTNDEEIVEIEGITDSSYYFSTENIPSSYKSSDGTSVTVNYKATSTSSLKKVDCQIIGNNVAVFNRAVTGFDSVILCIPRQIPGTILMYLIMKNGIIPTDSELLRISEKCNDDSVRCFNDKIIVKSAKTVSYNISIKAYIDPRQDAETIKSKVLEAVEEYKIWQYEKIGRNINKDKLQMYIMQAGAYKVSVSQPNDFSISSNSVAICSSTIVNFIIEEEL